MYIYMCLSVQDVLFSLVSESCAWFVQVQVAPIMYEGVVFVVMVFRERETGATPTDTDNGENKR